MWNSACLLDSNSLHASQRALKGFEFAFPSMGSPMNLRWFSQEDSNAEQVLADAIETAAKWVAVMSDYDPESEAMSACNEADRGKWVRVSEELWSVIDACDQWNRWSEGAFDASLGALTRLRRLRKPTTDAQWNAAQATCGWNLIELDSANRSFRTQLAGVRFDFGAIGKGFVVDRIAEMFQAQGIEQFVINSSGNMRMGKAPDGKTGWPVSIEMPAIDNSPEVVELGRFRLSDRGIATSGDRWQRFPDKANANRSQHSSHIVDPKTKHGVSGQQSVTILADNAADADAAATATSVRTQRNLPGWIETLERIKPNLSGLILIHSEEFQTTRSVCFGKNF